MSRPWMPLYVADYLADTNHLSGAEHGAYLLLIMHYWQKGSLPDDDRRLASIARASLEQWSDMKDTIAEFFDEGWAHARIDAELAEAEEKYQKRANAGRKGGNAKAAGKQSHSNASGNDEAGLNQPQSHSSTKKKDADASFRRECEREFEETFWPVYPLKKGKPEAFRAFIAARRRASLEVILAGVHRYAAERLGQDKQYTKQAQGWLNRDGWNDEPTLHHMPPPRAGPHRAPNAIDAALNLRNREDERAGPANHSRNDELLPPDKPELRSLVANAGQAMRWTG